MNEFRAVLLIATGVALTVGGLVSRSWGTGGMGVLALLSGTFMIASDRAIDRAKHLGDSGEPWSGRDTAVVAVWLFLVAGAVAAAVVEAIR